MIYVYITGLALILIGAAALAWLVLYLLDRRRIRRLPIEHAEKTWEEQELARAHAQELERQKHEHELSLQERKMSIEERAQYLKERSFEARFYLATTRLEPTAHGYPILLPQVPLPLEPMMFPHSFHATRVIEEKQPEAIPEHVLLPGPCDFADILELWRPTSQAILLALAPGGEHITVPLKALCHVALCGSTGGGKSMLMRLLLSQLIYVHAQVVLCDPHFAPFDAENGEDWRPIAKRLYMEPSVSYAAIKDTLRWLATDELPKRLEKRRQGLPVGTPYFCALDELPAIIASVPEAADYMGTLLREGRKVGLYLVSAAQDFLVKSIGGQGAVRDCFRTAVYVGGDPTSARVLLDIKGRVDDGGLGKGIVMMRSSATPQAALSRVPYASNDALYDLLSLPASVPTTDPLQSRFTETVIEADAEVAPSFPLQPALDARSLHVRDMLRSGMSQRQIIQELYGVSGGAAYTSAAKDIQDIIAKLI
jgi:Helicase HerA, central domain